MASESQVATLRLLIAEMTEESYTDVALAERIDSLSDGNLDRAAYDIWVEKAAAAAAMVNIAEAGSSRSMGDLHKNALLMVDLFKGRLDATAAEESASTAGTRIRKLTR